MYFCFDFCSIFSDFPLITLCSSLLSQALNRLSVGKTLCKPSGGFPVRHLLWGTTVQEGAVRDHRGAPDRRRRNGKPDFPRAA